MGRNQFIFGRIVNKLKLLNVYDAIENPETEIYDRMQQAQDAIFERVTPKRTFTINLVSGVSDYKLTKNDKDIIGAIIDIIVPTDYNLTYKAPSDWNKMVQSSLSGRPKVFTVIGTMFRILPVPTEYVTLELIAYQTGSEEEISYKNKEDDPELSQRWDRAIEYDVTFQYTDDAKYLDLFEREINIKGFLEHDKTLNTIDRDLVW